MTTRIEGPELLPLLSHLVDEAWDGVMYLRSDDNHLAMISMQQGAIVSLSSGPRRGAKAIPLIRGMVSGTYRLDPEARTRADKNLAPTGELLRLLAGDKESEPTPVSVDDRRANTPPPVAQTVAQSGDAVRAKKALCDLLGEYLGPISPVVCDEAVAEIGELTSGEKLRRIILRLAREVEDPDEAQEFTARARAQLRDLLA